MLHQQLKLGLVIKPHRVGHGYIVGAISLKPGLNPQLEPRSIGFNFGSGLTDYGQHHLDQVHDEGGD